MGALLWKNRNRGAMNEVAIRNMFADPNFLTDEQVVRCIDSSPALCGILRGCRRKPPAFATPPASPTLILWGADDRHTPLASANALSRRNSPEAASSQFRSGSLCRSWSSRRHSPPLSATSSVELGDYAAMLRTSSFSVALDPFRGVATTASSALLDEDFAGFVFLKSTRPTPKQFARLAAGRA